MKTKKKIHNKKLFKRYNCLFLDFFDKWNGYYYTQENLLKEKIKIKKYIIIWIVRIIKKKKKI